MDAMPDMVRRAFQKVEAAKKPNVPWKPQEPSPQPYFTYSDENKSWEAQTPSSIAAPAAGEAIRSVAIYSWNIDFMLPFPDERMTAALDHLASLIFPAAPTTDPNKPHLDPPAVPTVIFMQELLASDLAVFQRTPWIQSYFHLTDLDPTTWGSGYYGTATLVDKRLPITSVFRVHYADTKMERDGLFVDLALSRQAPTDQSHILRTCNTHLESLIADPPLRPLQLRTASHFMHSAHSSVLAGDLNAIQSFDATLHLDQEVQLRDAFLEHHQPPITDPMDAFARNPDTDTWGFTAPKALREKFGTTRMDKFLFCGRVRVVRFERFGGDVVIPDEEMGRALCEEAGTERPWVTDHLGIVGVFEVVEED